MRRRILRITDTHRSVCVLFMTAAEPLGHRVTMQLSMHADVSGNIGEHNSVGDPMPEQRPLQYTLYGPTAGEFDKSTWHMAITN